MSNNKLHAFLDLFIPTNISDEFNSNELFSARSFIGTSLVLCTTNLFYIINAYILNSPTIVKIIFFSNILVIFSLLFIMKISSFRLGAKVKILSLLLVSFVYTMLFVSIYFDFGLSFFSVVWFFPSLIYSSFLFTPLRYLKVFLLCFVGIGFLAYLKFDVFYDVISRHSNFKVTFIFYFFSSYISVFCYSLLKSVLYQNLFAENAEKNSRSVSNVKCHALEKMTAKVAHDVNNPLFVIQGKVHQLLPFLSEAPGAQEKVDLIMAEIEAKIFDLSNKVKLVSAFAKDGLVNQMVVADIAEIFQASLKSYAHLFLEREIMVEVYVENKLSLICYPSYVREILGNLLENAMESLRVANVDNKMIHLKASVHKQWVYIEVKDNAHEIIRDFDKENDNLTIAQGLSELQDGRLSYQRESMMNNFRVELPSYEEEDEEEEEEVVEEGAGDES